MPWSWGPYTGRRVSDGSTDSGGFHGGRVRHLDRDRRGDRPRSVADVIGQVISVEWIDAMHRFEVSPGDDLACVTAFTVGVCLACAEGEYVSVAQEVLGNDAAYRGVTSIPWSMVVEVKVLGVVVEDDVPVEGTEQDYETMYHQVLHDMRHMVRQTEVEKLRATYRVTPDVDPATSDEHDTVFCVHEHRTPRDPDEYGQGDTEHGDTGL